MGSAGSAFRAFAPFPSESAFPAGAEWHAAKSLSSAGTAEPPTNTPKNLFREYSVSTEETLSFLIQVQIIRFVLEPLHHPEISAPSYLALIFNPVDSQLYYQSMLGIFSTH
jgi:hypothetical protein